MPPPGTRIFRTQSALRERKVQLCRIRLTAHCDVPKGLHIKSTLDNTFKLECHTDEDIAFTDDDLVAIKNASDVAIPLTLTGIRLPDGRRAVLSPSRASAFTVVDPEVSTVRNQRRYTLGAGETLMLRSSLWVTQRVGGAVFPV